MDELSAYLDRGWDLVQKGDLRGARAAARRALQTDKTSPEAHNLLGYICAQEGDADEALEHYRQAMALDEGYIDPMLNAAEVLIHPLHEFDEAIALCDEVLELVEGSEEITDTILLKFNALLAKGDHEGARALLDRLPEEESQNPVHRFLLGRAWFEAGATDRAEPYLRKSVEAEPRNSDAHHYLGLIAEQRGDFRAATLSFLEVRELDLQAQRPAWALPKEAFEKVVNRAIAQLDKKLLALLDGALVLIADAPGMEMVADGVDPRAPMMLDALSNLNDPPPIAQRVFIYQRNVESLCGGLEQLEEELVLQLQQEIAHAQELQRSAQGEELAPRRMDIHAVVRSETANLLESEEAKQRRKRSN